MLVSERLSQKGVFCSKRKLFTCSKTVKMPPYYPMNSGGHIHNNKTEPVDMIMQPSATPQALVSKEYNSGGF